MKPIPHSELSLPIDGRYKIKEIFYSLQGEGILSGVPMIFIRFSECNLRCTEWNSAGFNCDTDFLGGELYSLEELVDKILSFNAEWILLTGGEPLLQADARLFNALFDIKKKIAIETNGTLPLPNELERLPDWVTVSPKSAWHTLKMKECDELRIVIGAGTHLPNIEEIPITADHYVASVRFLDNDGAINLEDLKWAISEVKRRVGWRLSMQMHKILAIR